MKSIIDKLDTKKVSLESFIEDCVEMYMKKLNSDITAVSDMHEKVYVLESVYRDLESLGYMQPWDCIEGLSNLEEVQSFIDDEEEED